VLQFDCVARKMCQCAVHAVIPVNSYTNFDLFSSCMVALISYIEVRAFVVDKAKVSSLTLSSDIFFFFYYTLSCFLVN